jgi:hypothetical protein
MDAFSGVFKAEILLYTIRTPLVAHISLITNDNFGISTKIMYTQRIQNACKHLLINDLFVYILYTAMLLR